MDRFRIIEKHELEKDHLSFLRELGRQMGLRAPAAKSKPQLIEEILK